MTVTARFDGDGFLENADGDPSTPNTPIARGEEFTVTVKRFKELQAQGIPVTQVKGTTAAATSNAEVKS